MYAKQVFAIIIFGHCVCNLLTKNGCHLHGLNMMNPTQLPRQEMLMVFFSCVIDIVNVFLMLKTVTLKVYRIKLIPNQSRIHGIKYPINIKPIHILFTLA